jgi:hypothetical protein
MVIEVLAATYDVHTTVQNALIVKIRVLRAMMAITPVLLETAHRSVYPDVKHAQQEPRVHHVRRDIITPMVNLIVTVLFIVIVIMVSVCHVRTDITIPVIYVTVYVQVTVSLVRQIMIVDRVRMVIIKVTRTTTLIFLC